MRANKSKPVIRYYVVQYRRKCARYIGWDTCCHSNTLKEARKELRTINRDCMFPYIYRIVHMTGRVVE